ncbi:MAG: hypothetical protein AB2375_04405 [Tissierellaceae bacterium]
MVVNYYKFSTEFGDMGIYFNEEGLFALSFLNGAEDRNHNYILKNFQYQFTSLALTFKIRYGIPF